MLKRQRASSPFPQPPSIPQDITSEGIFDVRDLKRRRVAQPSFDGRDAYPSNSRSTAGDCREEGPAEDKGHGRSQEKFAQSDRNTEYAEVNTVLKEMHILHKHRQMFASLLPNSPQSHSPHYEHNKFHSSHHLEYQTLAEESARVYEHYEGTNR